MAKIRYWWTEDGQPEICEAEKIELNNETRCYHCDNVIPGGEAMQLTCCVDGDKYILHLKCFKKSCESIV